MNIGGREFDLKNHTYIMGILNVTPDSFSDGGKYSRLDEALFHVEEMLGEGMDLLDIGGESTRPGHTFVPAQEETERVVPIIEAVKRRFDVPVSLDTYKAEVASEGLKAGVDMINDIWGLKYDPDMACTIAKAGVPCVLMHNRKETDYHQFVEDVVADLRETVRIAKSSGIKDEQIVLDPGIGFGKTYGQNLEMLYSLERLLELEYPVLLGASRKSVVGLTLDLPADQRMEGTLVTTVFGVMKGCSFVRVHDIKEHVRAVKMTEAILLSGGALPRGRFC
ncbi:MAG: dihydropteroate synthase [Lachnospiraceae bacterium]|nr:dihydropteroate synthase [Lachnospiraceae bacterium]GFI03119.1 dihydropteroate synthase [Lachnospiraceae bacterium]